MFSLRNPYKKYLKVSLFSFGSPNPYIYRCKVLPFIKQYTFFTFMEEKFEREWNSERGRRALGIICPVMLCVCVCFCVSSTLTSHENPIRSETFVGE